MTETPYKFLLYLTRIYQPSNVLLLFLGWILYHVMVWMSLTRGSTSKLTRKSIKEEKYNVYFVYVIQQSETLLVFHQ
jgi:hypothetical protein